MNERYTYGYGVGWNVENEYINSLSDIMVDFNNQVNAISIIQEERGRLTQLLQKDITEEQIREWYNEDYVNNGSLKSYESYKNDILAENDKRKENVSLDLSKNQDRYFANLYFLIQIKQETRKSIHKRKNELELLLSEKNIQLSSISLEQRKTGIVYNEEGLVANSKQLQALNEKYDEVWLEIRKIEHALNQLNEMFNLVEFTKEEEALMLRGLNPQQKKIYDEEINKTPKPTPKEKEDDEFNLDLSEYEKAFAEYERLLEMYKEDLERLYELQASYERGEIEYSEYERYADYMVGRYDYILGAYENLMNLRAKYEDLIVSNSKNSEEVERNMILLKVPEKPLKPAMIKEKEVKIEIDDEPEEELDNITLDGIIAKVCGNEKFNDRQSSRYAASKIKLFNKPQKDNLGLAYKIVSIPRKVIGIIPKTAMKIYGLFISNKTKQIFKSMEERANKLTDQEVEKLLAEYSGAVAQGKRIPKGFNDAIRPRVNLYVGQKVAVINEEIKNNLLKINYCGKVVAAINEKLAQETDPSMIAKLNEVLDKAYESGAVCVKDLISLQIEGNNLQNGKGLHSFEEELKALDTKLNYVGGRFSKTRTYDPALWSRIADYSQKIEYSLDSKEVLDAYLAREQIYKENTKEKRSIFNLGSKVTAGKLDYRPFVESLNYGNDPFIRDLITSVLVISSTASLINNITNNIKNAQTIEKYNAELNQRVSEHNNSIADHNDFVNEVRGSGDTIEKGITYDIRETEGAFENMAERGILDKYNWSTLSKGYKADDLAHHLESGNLSVSNTNAILDLTNKYNAGQITHAELIRGIQGIKEQTAVIYERNIADMEGFITTYAQNNPQFDYTAILSAIKHARSNPMDSVEMTDLIAGLYEKSLNITDLQSLSVIDATISSASLVPDILTLGATVAKVSQEEMDTILAPKPDGKKAKELREMIEGLKSLKAELTEEDLKELETLIQR